MSMTSDPYSPDPKRYDGRMPYRRCGRWGIQLPAITLGCWHNFGGDIVTENQRAMIYAAFDAGITHFDLANNYGPPYGSAEVNVGKILKDLPRDEILITTKAGYDMWPGPYGNGGSRKYLLSSLDQSLSRMQLDYVDIFYSHRVDPETPLEETMGALVTAVHQGKALYVGISSYGPELTIEAVSILKQLGVPCLIHQPSYSLFNRWIETSGLLETLQSKGVGAIAFSPLAQGLLTDKYLHQVPDQSRASTPGSFDSSLITAEVRSSLAGLKMIADERGQSMAQLAISWVLRQPSVASALIGVRSEAQLLDAIQATSSLQFSSEELASIEAYSREFDLNLWAESSNRTREEMP
ncbi:MAG: aldo/keto reductase [Litorivicinaceae bacterium]|nr:aldo/keto reductase [Litorivicinaceae bacterium]